MRARQIRYPDGFAFERGLENKGYTHDPYNDRRAQWCGFPVEIQTWTHPTRRDALKLLLVRVGDTYELYKQTDIGAIFDGDEDEILEVDIQTVRANAQSAVSG